MTSSDLFYTAGEVASMFRLTRAALSSRRKRGSAPGAFAVKVGGTYLYPKNLIDHYISDLAGTPGVGDRMPGEDRSRDAAETPPDLESH